MTIEMVVSTAVSHGRRALVVTAVLTTISIVIVAMRFYARLGLMKIFTTGDFHQSKSCIKPHCDNDD
jgi:hypothetical protein